MKYLRRYLATLLSSFAFSLSAAQEYPAATPCPIPEGTTVPITFYSYNLASAGAGRDGTLQLISEFEALHAAITVEGVGIPDQEIVARTQAAIVAGTPPDVAQLIFDARSYVATNFNVKPLEAIVPPAELKAHLAGMSPNGLELGRVNGQTYGLAFTFSTPVLYYNADLFREAGLDPEQPPQNWAEVKDYALQIVRETGQTGYFGGPESDWIYEGLLLSNGAQLLSEDTDLSFAEPEAVEVVAMLRDLRERGAMPPVDLGVLDAADAFSAGNLGMMLTTSALQTTFLQAAEGQFKLRSAKLPAFGEKPAVPTNSGSALFILADDPLKQCAAWEFMKFVTSERGYTIITSQIGYLPLRTGIVNDPEYLQGWVEEHPLIRPNLEQLNQLASTVSFPGPNYEQIDTVIMDALEHAVYGESDDVAGILQEAQDRASALLP